MRALLPICILSFLGVAAASAAGCSASISFPSGAIAGTITGVPDSCSGQVYVAVPFSDCSFLTACSGGTVYALCDGSSYTECDCDNPGTGWDVSSGGSSGGDGSSAGSDGSSGGSDGSSSGGDGSSSGGDGSSSGGDGSSSGGDGSGGSSGGDGSGGSSGGDGSGGSSGGE